MTASSGRRVGLESLEDHASDLYPFGIYQDVDGLPILKLSSESTQEFEAAPCLADCGQRYPVVTLFLGALQDGHSSPLEVTHLTKQIVTVCHPLCVHGFRESLRQVRRCVPSHRCFGNVA